MSNSTDGLSEGIGGKLDLFSAVVPTTPPNAFDSLFGIVLLGLVLLMGIFWFLAKMQDLFPSKEEKARIARFREHQVLITKMTNGDTPETREDFVAHYPNGVTVDGDWTIRTPDGQVFPLPWQARKRKRLVHFEDLVARTAKRLGIGDANLPHSGIFGCR